jgi:outer membrane usher protein
MPVGALVTVIGRGGQFTVAQRGEAYVTGLAQKNRLRATWRDQSCEFEVERPSGAGPQPRIGPIACAGVQR